MKLCQGIWFQPNIEREEAEVKLKQQSKPLCPGAFVIRASSRKQMYTLTVLKPDRDTFWHGLIKAIIVNSETWYLMHGADAFPTLVDVVVACVRDRDKIDVFGLPCALVLPSSEAPEPQALEHPAQPQQGQSGWSGQPQTPAQQPWSAEPQPPQWTPPSQQQGVPPQAQVPAQPTWSPQQQLPPPQPQAATPQQPWPPPQSQSQQWAPQSQPQDAPLSAPQQSWPQQPPPPPPPPQGGAQQPAWSPQPQLPPQQWTPQMQMQMQTSAQTTAAQQPTPTRPDQGIARDQAAEASMPPPALPSRNKPKKPARPTADTAVPLPPRNPKPAARDPAQQPSWGYDDNDNNDTFDAAAEPVAGIAESNDRKGRGRRPTVEFLVAQNGTADNFSEASFDRVLERSAKAGDPLAQYFYALTLEMAASTGSEYSYKFWYRRAVASLQKPPLSTDPAAMILVAYSAFYGRGMTVNEEVGHTWARDAQPGLLKLAADGDARAQNDVAECLWNGWGCEEDRDPSLAFRQRALEQDYAPALYWYATWHLDSYDEAKSVKKADKVNLLSEATSYLRKIRDGPYHFKSKKLLETPRIKAMCAELAYRADCQRRREGLVGWTLMTSLGSEAEKVPTYGPGEWVPDGGSALCMSCSEAFSVLRRKHHCRFCGLLVCKKCVQPHVLDDKNLACSDCLEVLDQYEEMLEKNNQKGQKDPAPPPDLNNRALPPLPPPNAESKRAPAELPAAQVKADSDTVLDQSQRQDTPAEDGNKPNAVATVDSAIGVFDQGHDSVDADEPCQTMYSCVNCGKDMVNPDLKCPHCNDVEIDKKPKLTVLEDDAFLPILERSAIIISAELGAGHFGNVYRGLAVLAAGQPPTPCAIKQPNANGFEDFKSEVHINRKVASLGSHPNLVSALGQVNEEGVAMLVLELVPLGNLNNLLRMQTDFPPPVSELTHWGFEIASAMAFLERNDMLHRDLATRNVMLTGDRSCKLGDFGLSKDTSGVKDYYRRVAVSAPIPVRWMAIETLAYDVSNIKSDCWSFGVVMWELFQSGARPYPGLQIHEVYDYLTSGQRMAQPRRCPNQV